MKLKMLFAVFVMLAVGFAPNTGLTVAGVANSAGDNITVDATMNYSGGAVSAVLEPVVVSAPAESRFGACEITADSADGYTLLKAVCGLTLPTPCHKISYGWLPTREADSYKFKIVIEQQPVACVEATKETTITDSVKVREAASATYEIEYRPAVTTTATSVQSRERMVEAPKSSAALCANDRIRLESELRTLYLKLERLRSMGDQTAAEEIQNMIRDFKQKLDEMPSVSDCAKLASGVETPLATKVQDKIDRIKDMELKLRLVNPCSKLQYLDEKIEELKLALDEESGSDAEAVKEKLGALLDIREKTSSACESAKLNEACVAAFKLRSKLSDIKERIQDGSISDEISRKAVADMVGNYARYQEKCFTSLLNDMDEHPCITAQLLRIQVAKMSDDNEGADVIPLLYEKVKHYENKCRAKNTEWMKETAKNFGEQKKEIALRVGELELQKQLVAMDETLSDEEKTRQMGRIELKKKELIIDALRTLKQARVSATVRTKFRPNMVDIEGQEEKVDNVSIELPTSEDDAEGTGLVARIRKDRVDLVGRKAVVRVRNQLEFENGVLKFGNKEIILPDEMMDKIRAYVGDLELVDKNGTAFYNGTVKKKVRLFAIIPISMNADVEMNAETGDTTRLRQPWWAVFTVG